MEDIPTPHLPGWYPPTPGVDGQGGVSTPKAVGYGEKSPLDIAGAALNIDGKGPSTLKPETPVSTVDTLSGQTSQLSIKKEPTPALKDEPSSHVDKLVAPAPPPNLLESISPLTRKVASTAPTGPETPLSDGAALAAAFLASEEVNHSRAAQEIGASSEPAVKSVEPLDEPPMQHLDPTFARAPVSDHAVQSPVAALLHQHAPTIRDPSPPQANEPMADDASTAAIRGMSVGSTRSSVGETTPERGASSDGHASGLAPALAGAGALSTAAVAAPIMYARQGSFPASASPTDLRSRSIDTQVSQPTQPSTLTSATTTPPQHETQSDGATPVSDVKSSSSTGWSPSREQSHNGLKGAAAIGTAGAVGAGIVAHQSRSRKSSSELEANRDRIINSASHSQDPTARYSPRVSMDKDRPHKLHKAPVAPSARQTREIETGGRKSMDGVSPSGSPSSSWRRTRRDSTGSSTSSPVAAGVAAPTSPPSTKPKGLRRLSWRRSNDNLNKSAGPGVGAVPPVPLLKSETAEERFHRERAHAEKQHELSRGVPAGTVQSHELSHVEQVAKQAAMDPNAPAPGTDEYQHHFGHQHAEPGLAQARPQTDGHASPTSPTSPTQGRNSVTFDDQDRMAGGKPEKERKGLSKLLHRRSLSKSKS